MRLLIHFLVSLILAAILFPLFGSWSLVVFIGGFFIDVDHYFWYVVKKKSLSLRKSYYYHRDREYLSKHGERQGDGILLHIFHVFEFWIVAFILVFFHKFFLIVFLGILIHITLDITDMVRKKAYRIRAISLFYWIFKQAK